MSRDFVLPPVISKLVDAREQLREHYKSANLRFTFDGNLVGDIGEAIAAELFGIKLLPPNGTGIDGYAEDGRSVQVKATGTRRGPAFRIVDKRADHLLYFQLDFNHLKGRIIYNGPEHKVLSLLPPVWVGQRLVSTSRIRIADEKLSEDERLRRVDLAPAEMPSAVASGSAEP